jgi:hypothetical protein
MARYSTSNIPVVKIKLLETAAMIFYYNIELALQLLPVAQVV